MSKLRLAEMDYSVLQQCMHCGMCLPSCPTYNTTGLERNSPRGRIALMRSIADGELELKEAFAEEMNYCLGCLACTSACPAGVEYASLFEASRADIEENRILDTSERRFWRWITIRTLFLHPRLLRLTGRALWIYQNLGLEKLVRASGILKLLPKKLRELEPLAPRIRESFTHELVAESESPPEKPRYRVALLTGCVQDLILSELNRDTADVLLVNGCEVLTLPNQACCGSLHSHNGEEELAKQLARKNIDSYDLENVDAIISNAGGCGSHLKRYAHLLSNDSEYANKAKTWDSKVKDIHEWLCEIGFCPPGPLPVAKQVTYHPSCHLNHGQGVRQQPVEILKAIPNLTLVPLTDADTCCGSAGIYNLTQPEQAGQLQSQKASHIRDTRSDIVATANPGCHLQIQNAVFPKIEVRHPISLLAEAYRNCAISD
ncbi:(Fe-S)-binding protein [Pelagicoccus mobilis]|uniref:Glycolate oxidase iron-sulfur subunit n=1 Tax=Pelagicoccus mobilis TaxID=415221 RepID=A0A934RYL9_9BACT|nr:(Fe-S)-binding protein [Pelagicoccus mobilis]MBK1879122.1 (Fe-S)-binding protein [Pelagicoccus mobilis]